MSARMSDAEWRTRQDLAAVYRLIALNGWDHLNYSHASARVPDEPGHYLINPFGLIFDQVTASNLVKVDYAGNVVTGDHPVNAAGTTIHGAVMAARADVGCVIHIHTVAGGAVSALADGLVPVTQDGAAIIADLAYHDFEGIVVDEAEGRRLVGDLSHYNYLILRNHGTLVTAPDCGLAFMRMHFMEMACRQQLAAQATGARLLPIPPAAQAQIDGVTRRMARGDHDSGVTAHAPLWASLRRKLDALDPSYGS